MEKIKKGIEEILRILDDMKKELESAYYNTTVFYTSLKEKDSAVADYHLRMLKESSIEAFDKFVNIKDAYDIIVLEEEE